MRISISAITKRFAAFAALDRVNLEIASGNLVALLGPSGSGKTTLLRIIAGLEWPDEGEVYFDGEDALSLTVGERNVGFVFQNYALFRHMTVFENVAFGLRARRAQTHQKEGAIRARVEKLLDLVQLGELGGRYPNQLSGGQRQRIALARALAIEPRVLLLDEPFGALDARVRKELRRWLRRLHDGIHVTSVFVTHDQEEAMEVADQIVVMDKGRIEQVGTPQEVYERPATSFVHDFIGESIVVPVEIAEGRVRFAGEATGLAAPGLAGGKAQLFVRPFDMAVVPVEQAPLRGTVKGVHGIGPARRVEIVLGAEPQPTIVELDPPRNLTLSVGQAVGLSPQRYRVFA